MNIWMQDEEISAISKHLNPNLSMLEWGSGGSTFQFSKLTKEYYSIEHDLDWFNKIQKEISSQNLNVNIKYIAPNINVPKETDAVFQGAPKDTYKDYVNYINTIGKEFDRILVDGRDRVGCAKSSLPYIKKDGLLFLHDFRDNRLPHYGQALSWYNKVDQVKSLIILQPK